MVGGWWAVDVALSRDERARERRRENKGRIVFADGHDEVMYVERWMMANEEEGKKAMWLKVPGS